MRAQSIVERLEFVSKRVPNLKFTPPTQLKPGDDQGCFMSCDMFYIEIKLDQTCQFVKDVVISHGNSQEGISCSVLKNVLSEQDYETFAKHLLGLHSIYQINTSDKKVKQRAYPSLTALEQDLTLLYNYQRNSINDCHNLVHKSPLGVMEPRKGGLPVRLYFFISPYDLLDLHRKEFIDLTINDIIEKNLGLSVTVEIEGLTNPQNTCKLQVKSLISTQQTSTGKSLPAFAPLNNQNSEKLPAQFVLKLSQPLPLATSSINQLMELADRMGEPASIKEYFTSLTNSKESLMNLLARQLLESSTKNLGNRFETLNTMNGEVTDIKRQIYNIQLKGDIHTYHIVNSHFDKQEGVFVERIPFTHPTSIPSILMILRQQALFNSIIGSCIRPSKYRNNGIQNNNSDYHDDYEQNVNIFEVTPINLSSICVSFEHPSKESLATVEIDLKDINELKCQLYARDVDGLCSNAFASKIIQKCWSVPITLRTVLRKCNETRAALLEEVNKKREKEFENLLINNTTTQDSVFQSSSNVPSQESLSAKTKQSPMSIDDHDISQHQSSNIPNNRSSQGNSSGLLPNRLLKPDGGVLDQVSKTNYLKRFSCQPRINSSATLNATPNTTSNLTKVVNKLNNKEAQRKASTTKQSNTILMSMLSDIPAAVAQSSSPRSIKRSRAGINKKVIPSSNVNQGSLDLVKAVALDSNAVQNKIDFTNKATTNNVKSKYPRPSVDQFAIKQGSSGLKLTVKKTKLSGLPSVSTSNISLASSSTSQITSLGAPASSSTPSTNSISTLLSSSTSATNTTPSTSSAAAAQPTPGLSSSSSNQAPTNSTQSPQVEASKLFNTATASGIKYKIPKISKTQISSQSSSTNQASSSDSSNPNNEHSNNNGNGNHDHNNDPSSSVSSTNAPSSTTTITNKRTNPTPFGRVNNQQRNSVTSSTHPFGRPTMNPLAFTSNKASSSTPPNNRISSSNNNNIALNNTFQLNRPEPFQITIPQQPQQTQQPSQQLPQIRALTNPSLGIPNPVSTFNTMPQIASSMNANAASSSVQYIPAFGISSNAFSQIPIPMNTKPATAPMGVSEIVSQLNAVQDYAAGLSTSSAAPSNYQPFIPKMVQQRANLMQKSSNNSCDTSTQPTSGELIKANSQNSNSNNNNVINSSDSNAAPSASKGAAATLSTPSSPTDCNQADSLPPPTLIPIDSLDDKSKGITSPGSELVDDASEYRLSIVDTNEINMADSNSASAATPRASDVESPQVADIPMDVSQQRGVATSSSSLDQRDVIHLD